VYSITKKIKITSAAVGVALSLLVAGCGNGDEAEPISIRTASNGEVFNDADVEFAPK